MRKKDELNPKKPKNYLENLSSIVTVAALALLIITLFFDNYKMSGSSMLPIIEKEDRVLINRAAYLMREPKRFDLAYIETKQGDYVIKRIIGLPGERLLIEEGKIYIDGMELTDPYLSDTMISAGIASSVIALGEDEYFVLGDTSSFSEDSRSRQFGLVKRSSLSGKPWYILFPMKNMGLIR